MENDFLKYREPVLKSMHVILNRNNVLYMIALLNLSLPRRHSHISLFPFEINARSHEPKWTGTFVKNNQGEQKTMEKTPLLLRARPEMASFAFIATTWSGCLLLKASLLPLQLLLMILLRCSLTVFYAGNLILIEVPLEDIETRGWVIYRFSLEFNTLILSLS